MNFVMVALGGALGAVARYAISMIPIKSSFPFVTLGINFAGAFLIGIIVGMSSSKNMSDNMVLFWKTGVCGGFTTFSTFSLEAVTLFEAGHANLGIVYAVCSVVLCMAGVFLGKNLIRVVL